MPYSLSRDLRYRRVSRRLQLQRHNWTLTNEMAATAMQPTPMSRSFPFHHTRSAHTEAQHPHTPKRSACSPWPFATRKGIQPFAHTRVLVAISFSSWSGRSLHSRALTERLALVCERDLHIPEDHPPRQTSLRSPASASPS